MTSIINILPLDGFDELVAEIAAERAAKFRFVSFEDVKDASLRDIDIVLGRYLPNGKSQANGKEYTVLNPARGDKKPGSFKINRHNGVWSDFSTKETGGDMIDLVAYLTGQTNVEAKNEIAELLGVQPRAGSTELTGNIREIRPTQYKIATIAAAPSVASSAPSALPPRTPPDEKGKPIFVVSGDEGPRARHGEKRRHFYRQGDVPVRVKIMKQEGASNAYRVIDANGVTGWQFGKPEGFQPIPYFVSGANPFVAEIGRTVFWVEGEKDVETVAALGGLAFTFGSTSDGAPEGCQQYVVGRPVAILADNDVAGRKHAEEKAVLIAKVATSVKVIQFNELPEKSDVSDWIASGKTFDDLKARVLAAEPWQPSAKPESEKPKHKLPYGYTFSDRGLMWKNPDDAESVALHIAGHFDIEAMTRDGDGNGWGLLLRWKDQDGRDHRYALAHEHLVVPA